MLLTIITPVYNRAGLLRDCYESLRCQTETDFEWIIVDDGSSDGSADTAEAFADDLFPIRVIRKENGGKHTAINAAIPHIRGDYVLFLDSDGMPVNSNFLAAYLAAVQGLSAGAVCGSVAHPATLPSPAVSLRWLHETTYARRATVEWRNAHPYANFRTFNFLIHRDSFARVMFDEQVHSYGYEDNLFGRALQDTDVQVKHIDNPMMNVDIEENAAYLAKNEEALRTLAAHYDTMSSLITLAQRVEKVERYHLGWLLSLVYTLFRSLLLRNLHGSAPRMWVFNLYRAGYLRALLRKQVG